MSAAGRAVRWGVLAILAMGGVFVAGPAAAHAGSIDSPWASVVPTADGAMIPGEWADAASVDLGAIPGNGLSALLLAKNDGSYLWIAYDVTGDTTPDLGDEASVSFDTDHDLVLTPGREDEFVLTGVSRHLVYGFGWEVHDEPFNESLPDHAGLSGSRGFGPSDSSAVPHRTYELQIPLVLLGDAPGDTLGLLGASWATKGVWDQSATAASSWPDATPWVYSPWNFGDLNLAAPPAAVGVSVYPSSTTTRGFGGETVWRNLTVRNDGASGDTFDATWTSSWPFSLWDATGALPLADTDGDTTPDTGNVSAGAIGRLIAKVTIPPSAKGCDVANVTVTSSWDTLIADSANLGTCRGPALFRPPHAESARDTDSPPDGRYDALEIGAVIDVTEAGTFFVRATLTSDDGAVTLDSAYGFVEGGPGVWTVPFSFPGRTMFREGLPGPYLVRLELDDGREVADTDIHRTAPYAATDFDRPPAMLQAPHADFGNDIDVPPDGLYDWLVVNVTVVVYEPTFLFLETYFYDSSISDQEGGAFPVGTHVIPMSHPGVYFFASGRDGPYQLRATLQLYVLGEGYWYDTDVIDTAPYRAADFDPGSVYFAPPHRDFGVDADVPPDGWYDWLVVSVSLQVETAGTFRLYSTLALEGGYVANAEVTVALPTGPATADLYFPGARVYGTFRTANFTARIYLYRLYGEPTLYEDYVTRTYSYMEFQPPAAQFQGPHADRGIDASDPPDGYYDWLVVDAVVNVTREGVFRTDGVLWDGSARFLDMEFATANLTRGVHAVPLQFDARAITRGGFGGSFRVELTLGDATGHALDWDSQYTGTYDVTDLQPLDARAPSSSASAFGYWRNAGPLRVAFAATDAQPGDGIASVSLHYRHSADNATWSPWAWLAEATVPTVGRAAANGSFAIDPPDGEGYYEFYTIAEDHGGNAEAAPAAADASIGLLVPARIGFIFATPALTAGTRITLAVRAVDARSAPVPLETSLAVSLLAASPAGRFFTAGTLTEIAGVTIPAGLGEAQFDYMDTIAGVASVVAVAAGIAPGTAAVLVIAGPADSIEISPPTAAIGVASTLQFAATVRDAFGNPVTPPALAWTVTGPIGTIATDGTFTAATSVASGSVRATAGGLNATGDVMLRPGPVAAIEITGGRPMIAGERTTLVARALDAYGNRVPDAVFTWTIRGPGSLSATADAAELTATGAGEIRVTATAGSFSTTTMIQASSPSPLPVVGGVAAGLLTGLVAGWLLACRRGRTESGSEEPGEPQ